MSKRRRPKLPAGLFEAQIESLSHEGRGIARIEGKTTFIQGALEGERVQFQYTQRKKDFDEGVCVEVLEASEHRAEPPCEHYALCGGCSMQHLKPEQQIIYKQNVLLDLLKRYANVQPDAVLAPLQDKDIHYRNKARLSVRYVMKKEACLLGFRERLNPRFITDIQGCKVLNAKIDQDILPLRSLLDSFEDRQSIAQIELAAGDTEQALIFRNMNPLSPHDETLLKQFGEKHQYKIFLQPGSEDSVYLFYPEQGEFLSYELPAHQLKYEFHPTDFTQVNAAINRRMIDMAIDMMELSDEDRVLDLFCGLGNFSLALARYAGKVMGVEGSERMVQRANHNARLNGLGNVLFRAENLEDSEAVLRSFQGSYNKLLIDPPRSGAFEIVKAMDKMMPERIVYVSCNPVTLARDCDILVNQHQYKLKAAGVMDMFPHTAHVESIALFVRE